MNRAYVDEAKTANVRAPWLSESQRCDEYVVPCDEGEFYCSREWMDHFKEMPDGFTFSTASGAQKVIQHGARS